MSIFDLPRIHFRGTCRASWPTSISNTHGNIDIATNTVYVDKKKYVNIPDSENIHKYDHDTWQFQTYLRKLSPRFNADGQLDPNGAFNEAAGFNFEGSSHFFWENVSVTSTQTNHHLYTNKNDDPLIGQFVKLWGHYNEYLGSNANMARIILNDPTSHWTAQIYAGQLTIGQIPSCATTNAFTGEIAGIHFSRWLKSNHIIDLNPHYYNHYFNRAELFQFTVPKNGTFFLWNNALASPSIQLIQKALEAEDVLGLVVQYTLYNMANNPKPDMPAYYDIVGTISLWKMDEMMTYPAGRILVPKSELFSENDYQKQYPFQFGNLSVQITNDMAIFNMPLTIPILEREPVKEILPGIFKHEWTKFLNVGNLELGIEGTEEIIARISYQAYCYDSYHKTSGIISVPLLTEYNKKLLSDIENKPLYLSAMIEGKRIKILMEQEIIIQTDNAGCYLEYPNYDHNNLNATEVKIRTYKRGIPSRIENISAYSFYNPNGFPQFKYEFENIPTNKGKKFHFPKNSLINIVLLKIGRKNEIGQYTEKVTFSSNEQGIAWISLHGNLSGAARIFFTEQKNISAPLTIESEDEAEYNYDNMNRLNFWGYANCFYIRVLPNDWYLDNVSSEQVDFEFLYKHVLCYYALLYPIMRVLVFNLADRARCEHFSRLMWQMCDPINKEKSYYMPPTRELSDPKARIFLKYLQHVETENHRKAGISHPLNSLKPKYLGIERKINTREQLIQALKDSVELEICLMSQYIYAGYSLPTFERAEEFVRKGLWSEEQRHLVCGNGKEESQQGWRGTILQIAHDEMAHFIVANNLLMAIGEPFHACSPIWSKVSNYFPLGVECALEPFSATTIDRFIQFEWPTYFEKEKQEQLCKTNNTDTHPLYNTIGELYQEIRLAFQTIPHLIVVEKGKVGGQHRLFLNETLSRTNPDYQLQVDDVESALFGIDFITAQGEGILEDSTQFEQSHFQRFRKIKREFSEQQNIQFDKNAKQKPWNPAYPVIKNPSLYPSAEKNINLITDPTARQVLIIFETCYEIMIQLMVQHFGDSPYGNLRRSYVMNAAIDFMMGFLRPLGILLMNLPSGKKGYTAGPTFLLETTPKYISGTHAYKLIAEKLYKLYEIAKDNPVIGIGPKDLLLFYADYFYEYADAMAQGTSPGIKKFIGSIKDRKKDYIVGR